VVDNHKNKYLKPINWRYKMKIKKSIIFTIFIMILISCNHEDGILKDSEIVTAKKAIVEKGDKKNYSKLYIYFNEKENYSELLSYSLIMAHNYRSADAYFDVYEIMIKLFNRGNFDENSLEKLDEDSKIYALKHLLESADLGNSSAKKILIKYYSEGKYLPKNIVLANKIQAEITIKRN